MLTSLMLLPPAVSSVAWTYRCLSEILEVKFLKQNCVLNDKSYLFLWAYSWIMQSAGGLLSVKFSLRLVSWLAAIWMLFFCIQSMMFSFCLRQLQFSWRILRCVFVSRESLPCICFYCLALRAALTLKFVVPLLYGL